MKKYSLIILLLLLFTVTRGQLNQSKEAVIDELIQVTKVEESTQYLVNMLIDRKGKVSAVRKEAIHKEIDYKGYYNKVRQVYRDNYTESELYELVAIKRSGNQALFKMKTEQVKDKLYLVGKEFGKGVGDLIRMRLGG